MSWYSIFYWFTVADGIKEVISPIITGCWVVGVIALVGTLICLIGRAVQVSCSNTESEEEDGKDPDVRAWNLALGILRRFAYYGCVIAIILSVAGSLIPTKKDALVIIAGGAVSTFITKDTAAKQIPTEVMTLLRDKLRSEIKDIHLGDQIKDSLAGKTKEELIEMLKNKK